MTNCTDEELVVSTINEHDLREYARLKNKFG